MVNTFLPYPDFEQSAKCLDYRRLGKQRVEAMQIINVLLNPEPKGWKNHPAVIMWKNYIPALKHYCNVFIKEWISRGYKNTMKLYDITDEIIMPWWIGNKDFHYAHQASLIRKNKDFYADKFSDLPEEYKTKGYIWPRLQDNKQVIEFALLK